MSALHRDSGVEDGIRHFLEYLRVERNYAAYTLESYRCDLQQFARFLYPRIADASLPVKLVERSTVREFIEDLHMRGMKNSTVARKLTALRTFFASCVARVFWGPVLSTAWPHPRLSNALGHSFPWKR